MSQHPSQVKPEDCPEPFWHETHRYCPQCSWTEEPDLPTVEDAGRAIAAELDAERDAAEQRVEPHPSNSCAVAVLRV
jgi:hypothetical protein